MTNLVKEVCFQVKEARRARGISQSELAAELGCKQSALSMFEQGNPTKLADSVVKALCKKLGVEMRLRVDAADETDAAAPVRTIAPRVGMGFCPNAHCPSNSAYDVDGAIFYRVTIHHGGKFCPNCGEVLEARCPNCGAPLNEGAVCMQCGTRYIAV